MWFRSLFLFQRFPGFDLVFARNAIQFIFVEFKLTLRTSYYQSLRVRIADCRIHPFIFGLGYVWLVLAIETSLRQLKVLDGALAIQLILVCFLLSGLFLSSGARLLGAFDFLLLREYVR